MLWTVETLDERVDKELHALPADMLARFYRIGDLIEAKGLLKVGPRTSSMWQASFGKCA